jgi:hypothetical protein
LVNISFVASVVTVSSATSLTSGSFHHHLVVPAYSWSENSTRRYFCSTNIALHMNTLLGASKNGWYSKKKKRSERQAKCLVLSPPKPPSSVSYCLASSPTSTLGHVSVVDLTFMWYIRRGLSPIYYIATHCAGLTWGPLSAWRRPEISRLDMQLHNSPRPAVHAAWPARRFCMVLLKLLYEHY